MACRCPQLSRRLGHGCPQFYRRTRAPRLGAYRCFPRDRSMPQAPQSLELHQLRLVRTHGSCSTPDHYGRCPVPALPLRNGSLNRMAFSLFLFLRDVCEGDLVGWIDRHLASVSALGSDDYGYRLGQALIQPMRGIQGASDKVLNMALSDFLIAVDPARELWHLHRQPYGRDRQPRAQFAAPDRHAGRARRRTCLRPDLLSAWKMRRHCSTARTRV